MKYLGLAYYTPEKFAAMAPEDVEALVSQCPALDERMRATGKVLVSASLGDLAHWKTLRPSAGKTAITDGPYAETKEQFAGFFLVDVASRKPKAKGLDARTPAIWISNGTGRDGRERKGAPKVGWCWAGNRHTWLGFASAAARH